MLQSCSSAAAELRLDLFRCFGISFLHFWRLLVRLQESADHSGEALG